MARKPRIEYDGAVYHVLNRGDQGDEIFRDKLDYENFLACLKECCKRCGWRGHSYCLMPNHFHLLIETPEGNLVNGMKWFLGAYTQKFNRRHGLRGHLFQGRYKAQMIEPDSGGYFGTVSTYIHLNPARAGLLDRETPLLQKYPWSSYCWYLKASERPEWLEVKRVLGNLALKDDSRGRMAYAKYIQDRIQELRTRRGKKQYRELWKPIRYGWCMGGQGFEDGLLNRLKEVVSGRKRESYSGREMMRHDEMEAERLVADGLQKLKLGESDLYRLMKGSREKSLLAWLAHKNAMVGHEWIARRLQMGVAANIGKYVREISESRDADIARLRSILKK